MQCTEQEILGGCDVIGAEAQAYTGRGGAPMVDQGSGAREVSQQAQNGQGHEMVESVEQQIAGAVVDGSPAHQTTTPVAAAGAD